MTKRLLTKTEIDDILSIILPNKNIPKDISLNICELQQSRILQQLGEIMIYPDMIPELKEEINRQYYSSLIPPGESVGVIAGQSIGERQTQTMLNSFHFAGKNERTITVGVPRVEELMNATKEPKNRNCTIYFNNEHKKIDDIRKTIGHSLVALSLNKLFTEYHIHTNKEPERWYKAFNILHNNNYHKYTDCISIKINIGLLYEYQLTLEMIANKLKENYDDIECVFSPAQVGQLDIFVDTSKIDIDEDILYINKNNAKLIYMEDVVQPTLFNETLFGLDGINAIYYGDNMKRVDTDGSNFQKILGLEYVDKVNTMSNDIWDIYNTFGIEAVRQFFIEEFLNMMSGINQCHIEVLVDKMTFMGSISSISRYTMRTEESGPVSRCSFEESLDILLKAGLFCQEESTRGVSASIICGKRAFFGTGICDLKMDLRNINDLVDVKVKENSNIY